MDYFEGLDLIYHLANSRDFPTLAVAKYIRNHNKASRNVKKDFALFFVVTFYDEKDHAVMNDFRYQIMTEISKYQVSGC